MKPFSSNSILVRFCGLIDRLTARHDKAPQLNKLRLLAKNKKWLDVEVGARSMLAELPENKKVLIILAESLRNLNRLDEAVVMALRAASYPRAGWRPHFTAGLALKELGRMEEASDHLRMAAKRAPRIATILQPLIEVVAAVEGLEAAATEYGARCGNSNRRKNLLIAEICDIREWARVTGLTVLKAGEAEQIPYESPRVWGGSIPEEAHYTTGEKPCVAELTGCRIFGRSAIVLTADGVALSDTAGHPHFGRFVNLADRKLIVANVDGKVLLDTSSYQTRTIEEGILLAGYVSDAFGHWFPDYLPRLQFLRQHPDFERLPIIVDENMPQAHFDHLRRFADNPLIRLKANESFVCERLLMATAPSFVPVHWFPNDIPAHEMPGLSPRALRFLRGGDDVNPDGVSRNSRLFLGRRGMSWRRLLNEAEIGAELAKSGFETVYLEDMGMEEQIRVFRSAEWIVAPNGSALLNLVFSDPSVKLLVLSQPDLFNWGTFQGPMRSLGYNPVWLCGGNVAATGQKHADYQVPVEQMRDVLQEMGLDTKIPEKLIQIQIPDKVILT